MRLPFRHPGSKSEYLELFEGRKSALGSRISVNFLIEPGGEIYIVADATEPYYYEYFNVAYTQ